MFLKFATNHIHCSLKKCLNFVQRAIFPRHTGYDHLLSSYQNDLSLVRYINVKQFFCNVTIQVMEHLWKMGYSAEDIINNIFRVAKNLLIDETLKLDFVKVSLKVY